MKIKLLLLALLGAVLLVGCGSSDSAETDAGPLVVYSGRSESLVGPLIEQFEADTGIQTDVRYGSTGEIAALLLEEGDASPADIFYAQDPGGLGAVQNAGLLRTVPDNILGRVPDGFVSDDRQWVGVSGRARVVVYNTEEITDPIAQLPTDIEGFTDPQWRGRIGWAPTNGSFQAMVTAMRTVWGEARTEAWLSAIQANEPVVYANNTAIVSGVGAGEVSVGFVNHYYLYRFLAEEGASFAARNYFLPGGGPGSLIMVSGAGILDSSDNLDNAERFLAYLLSDEAQRYFVAETFEYALVDGVDSAENVPPLADIAPQALDIDVSDYADLEGTVQLLTELGILP